ncbi:cation diffusion facilitator family transporter [Trichloromonas sp.]|uniref:cation diffusion facilitator family transporter n=1 Tax=Trichloromonas sp. TaxID=3069249 RepID=UPI002A447803|nr:cation diffusion facilitator family transporter [Trichloromonas sp.]
MEYARLKLRAARTSIAVSLSLALLKLVTGILTGSMAVLASAVDSLLDILMSGVNYLAIHQADQPADQDHPFGHGKYETLATIIQALIITLSGAWIILESVRRLIAGTALTALTSGILALLASTAASLAISRYLRRIAQQTDSSALAADALHFAMDVYSNLALFAGLVIIQFVNVPWLDPVLSLLVGLYIISEAVKLLRHGLRDVLDEELPPEIRDRIIALIESYPDERIDYHKLRTRRAGSQKIMDFHLNVCKYLTVKEAHDIADRLEKRIKSEIRGADVTIHIEPCQRPDCPGRAACQKERGA